MNPLSSCFVLFFCSLPLFFSFFLFFCHYLLFYFWFPFCCSFSLFGCFVLMQITWKFEYKVEKRFQGGMKNNTLM